MLEREYLKEIMFILNREFDINFENDPGKDNQKINMWYEVLKYYPKHIIDQAVIYLLGNHLYKEIRCAHLNVACINAIEAPALEFGKKMVEVIDKYKSEYRIVPILKDEFGELGLKIYEANKDWLLYYKTVDRDKLIESMTDIYKGHLWVSFNKQKLLDIEKHKGISHG